MRGLEGGREIPVLGLRTGTPSRLVFPSEELRLRREGVGCSENGPVDFDGAHSLGLGYCQHWGRKRLVLLVGASHSILAADIPA